MLSQSPLALISPSPTATTTLDRMSAWTEAFRLWLDSRPALNTRRAYRLAWESFLAFTPRLPWEVGKADIALWADHLRSRRLSPQTIQQRLAALSSFYTYAMRVYTRTDPSGRELPLHPINPVLAVPRPRPLPYTRAAYLTPEQARQLLRAIPRHTLQGKRDYALFLAYLATGRRNSEIRTLRWMDFEFENPPSPWRIENGLQTRGVGGEVSGACTERSERGEVIWYRWTGKGKSRRDQCPLPVWQAILDYLSAARRLDSIQPADDMPF